MDCNNIRMKPRLGVWRRCHRKIADVTKAYNKAGGTFSNPFWTAMKKKNGKDWKEIFTQNLGNRR